MGIEKVHQRCMDTGGNELTKAVMRAVKTSKSVFQKNLGGASLHPLEFRSNF
jgi:hypothetical protein